MKVWIDMMVSNPPLERILDIFDWFAQILLNLACPKSNMIGHRDIGEGSKIVIVGLRNYD